MDGALELNKTQGSEHWLPCGNCHVNTCHKVLLSVDVNGDVLEIYYYNDHYQIVQCQGCKTISFRKAHTDSDDFIEVDGETINPVREEIYPSRLAGRQKLNREDLLPHDVGRIYSETHAALCSKQPVLAGIGIRALIETVCKEKTAQGSNLEKKIDSLVSMGVLTPAGAEILHGLRILGNEAAHEVKPHSEQTLGTAMEVVEHLLKGVYILPAVAKRFPKR